MRSIVDIHVCRLFLFMLLLIGFIGCKRTAPYVPTGDPHLIEDANPVVLLDKDLMKIVAVDRTGAQRTKDGRLKVMTTLRNLKETRQHVQVQTVFKDSNHFSLGEDSAWSDVILFSNETQSYTNTSFSPDANHFTIRIRLPR